MAITAEAIEYILSKYFYDYQRCTVSIGKSGYNNTTRFINLDNETYILRIYETHQDEEKVKLEHDCLIQLNQLADLPFNIPHPFSTIDGKTFIRLMDREGKIACIYEFIEGDNPVLANTSIIKSFGERTAQLLRALEKLKLQHPMVYRPYYEIEHTHPNCPMEKVIEWCNNPPVEFTDLKHQLMLISEQLIQFQESVPSLKLLPHQLIHGDLNESNMLTLSNDSIDAILDFEFITSDLRVMEVAVCFSDLIVKETDEQALSEKLRAYMIGFSGIVQLSDSEIQSLPILIRLRRLDVFVHFLGRHLDGIDEPEVLREQIIKASSQPAFMSGNGEKLIKFVKGLSCRQS